MGDDVSITRAGHDPTREIIALVEEAALPLIPWLDVATARALRQIVALVAREAPDALAAILFGSVARREERPLSDPHPSDVDLLILFAAAADAPQAPQASPSLASSGQSSARGSTRGGVQDTLTAAHHHILSWAIVRTLSAFPDAARDINVTGALAHFAHWDPSFVERLARDGILLWARGPLPPSLAPVETRDGF